MRLLDYNIAAPEGAVSVSGGYSIQGYKGGKGGGGSTRTPTEFLCDPNLRHPCASRVQSPAAFATVPGSFWRYRACGEFQGPWKTAGIVTAAAG